MRLFAPAKVNLALHVTGRRDDGYHLLDSVVVFADLGDRIDIAPSNDLSLTVTGPRAAGVPADRRNLIWQAAELFPPGQGAAITLDKHLPHAGGIGGGSADAAATLRGLAAFWDLALPNAAAVLSLGADVPVCLFRKPARMLGIGEIVAPLPPLPPLWVVLINPGIEVPTSAVFKKLTSPDNTPLPDIPAQGWQDAAALSDWLCDTRNDLEPPARALVPEIGRVIDHLNARPGCLLARMSGSGGTCFGLFATEAAATQAALDLQDRPDWWVAAARLLPA
ncbi:4-(cytidine 5'-diphospho)-2-C-methyl-D-erythritol kinase [Roseicyclus mahoneyensis]|uniref:4-diphosphocytidyl-2-C-methyl-D-erythritol kinase n=1 Tax=Roseicyclus mahoneyensis TaxID=164332 RepID=A0A316GLB0_9RHOB|nr:4-(cytidine 5'-diphospho)-2-C-methyl-D-erythritol kinase [Roseicyclus mahoneyensis]PWK60188.1 4-diphosphocytidyl-2-C-methyl-D-erythritol kinase [Roseicyclus mahoneyensis]